MVQPRQAIFAGAFMQVRRRRPASIYVRVRAWFSTGTWHKLSRGSASSSTTSTDRHRWEQHTNDGSLDQQRNFALPLILVRKYPGYGSSQEYTFGYAATSPEGDKPGTHLLTKTNQVRTEMSISSSSKQLHGYPSATNAREICYSLRRKLDADLERSVSRS